MSEWFSLESWVLVLPSKHSFNRTQESDMQSCSRHCLHALGSFLHRTKHHGPAQGRCSHGSSHLSATALLSPFSQQHFQLPGSTGGNARTTLLLLMQAEATCSLLCSVPPERKAVLFPCPVLQGPRKGEGCFEWAAGPSYIR